RAGIGGVRPAEGRLRPSKRARGGDGGAGRRPLGTQCPHLQLTSRLSAPYTGEPSSVTRGTGSPPEGLISARYVTYRVYAGYPPFMRAIRPRTHRSLWRCQPD